MGSLPAKNLDWGTKTLFFFAFEKSGFDIFIALKNQPEIWSHLSFYLLRTEKYPEMFFMPFYAPGPLELTPSSISLIIWTICIIFDPSSLLDVDVIY